ncbi:hypothetical protein QA640_45725 (plasmid) [Bradyrhizobium sp. CB82]|uniref:hypothetical protein n=1 Tax=Bradyrhizobium sp. CB82 TaxID=3039159 RepID=UPI0024B07061|nr:hypothetical protein [Bradyrhizobium sp. CB82]WFU46063.1 hypothetical protein QA640_45725 [Bradyrhizobium sp. CB82]
MPLEQKPEGFMSLISDHGESELFAVMGISNFRGLRGRRASPWRFADRADNGRISCCEASAEAEIAGSGKIVFDCAQVGAFNSAWF